ncbi:ribonuclease I [Acetobacteraceae bacterium KSS8]|uniref:Ribonuclease I n=1 Tax=Endosaccharibacter trunci TaxID=2812733 RepID=A0ABT1W9B9_9PROT|nr:ribonuclease I [Acetobacteraceae bacterium KSS8]
MLRAILLACTVLLAAPVAASARVPDLEPAQHRDFDHYTLALSWTPGFCAEGSCTAQTAQTLLIGLHGLWASLPDTLRDRGIQNREWWAKGCDYFHRSRAYPSLPVALRRRLAEIMPQTAHDLLRHEYDKHVQCFGFDTPEFFQTAIAMHDLVANSPFGEELVAESGKTVARTDLLAAFARDFHTDHPRALQLQCHVDHDGSAVLSQLWITVRHDKIADFPAPDSLMDSPVPQDNCPARFTVSSWN